MVLKVDGEAIALAVVQPDAPVARYYVIAYGEVKPMEMSDAEAGTWRAFDLPIATQQPDQPAIRLDLFQSVPEEGTRTIYQFTICG